MPRSTAQSAIRATILPQNVDLNRGYAANYVVRARNQSAVNHGKKRVMITYVYLLILRDLKLRGALPDGPAVSIPMTLQAKGGVTRDNQCAHQVLGELSVGGRNIYTLLGLTQLERRAISYCTSAVSDIHKSYNFVDNFLEHAGRPGYVNLANHILREGHAGRALPNLTIFNGVIAIFKNACTQAKPEVRRTAKPEYRPLIPNMLNILDDHLTKIDLMSARSAQTAAHDTNHYMTQINDNAF
jgi:hypothetical protein